MVDTLSLHDDLPIWRITEPAVVRPKIAAPTGQKGREAQIGILVDPFMRKASRFIWTTILAPRRPNIQAKFRHFSNRILSLREGRELSRSAAVSRNLTFSTVGSMMKSKMIQEYYRQMRKFGCNILAVVQQYDIIKDSAVRGAMIGNSNELLKLKSKSVN